MSILICGFNVIRYLVKAWHQAISDQAMTPTVSYLQTYLKGRNPKPWECTLTGLVAAYQQVAAG